MYLNYKPKEWNTCTVYTNKKLSFLGSSLRQRSASQGEAEIPRGQEPSYAAKLQLGMVSLSRLFAKILIFELQLYIIAPPFVHSNHCWKNTKSAQSQSMLKYLDSIFLILPAVVFLKVEFPADARSQDPWRLKTRTHLLSTKLLHLRNITNKVEMASCFLIFCVSGFLGSIGTKCVPYFDLLRPPKRWSTSRNSSQTFGWKVSVRCQPTSIIWPSLWGCLPLEPMNKRRPYQSILMLLW